MRFHLRWLLALAAPLLGSCDPAGTAVVLNQRLFSLPSMKPSGSGCTTYDLKAPSLFGGGSSSGVGGGSAAAPSLTVEQRSDNDRVIVDVMDGARPVLERVYGLPFFQSGKVDEFTAAGSSETMLLRYWGAVDVNGSPQCAPPSDDGSRPPSP
jgi:hypothetical protein